jgi:hypothetical protein
MKKEQQEVVGSKEGSKDHQVVERQESRGTGGQKRGLAKSSSGGGPQQALIGDKSGGVAVTTVNPPAPAVNNHTPRGAVSGKRTERPKSPPPVVGQK